MNNEQVKKFITKKWKHMFVCNQLLEQTKYRGGARNVYV